MPFDAIWRRIQMLRGIFTDRISFASERNAFVASEMLPLNHVQGSSAESRKTMYGSWPALPCGMISVKTNQ